MSVPLQHDVYWQAISHLGAAGLMFPIYCGVILALLHSKHYHTASVWTRDIIIVALLALLSKVAFLGWGIGSARLDFTGISGHTLLPATILPVLFGWLLSAKNSWAKGLGIACGILLTFAVGISRIKLGYHSASEVFFAWIMGFTVSGRILIRLYNTSPPHQGFRLLPLFLLFAAEPSIPSMIPTYTWEVDIATRFSGRSHPYTRDWLRQRADHLTP